MTNEFRKLVEYLQSLGYKVLYEKYEKSNTYFALFQGNNVKGSFSEVHEHAYATTNGKIAFDHIDCYEKPSKCPYSLPLPLNAAHYAFLSQKLIFMGTDDAKELSDNYALEYVYEYPR